MSDCLPSTTYKIRAPGITDHAIYFTVVGDKVPECMFINSKEMESFQWISALMTSYSKQLKIGVDISNIIDDMCEVFDPNGAYMIPDGSNRTVNSLVNHLGLVLQGHVDNLKEV